MKTQARTGIFLSILFFFLCGTALGGLTSMSVQVKNGQLRSTPSFMGKVLKTVPYGGLVFVLETNGDWKRVSTDGQESNSGWIHSSALTPKTIVFRAGETDVEEIATNDELALAGKGFNKQVEQAYKSQNPDVDFSRVDRMENYRVSQQEMAAFLKKGEVTP